MHAASQARSVRDDAGRRRRSRRSAAAVLAILALTGLGLSTTAAVAATSVSPAPGQATDTWTPAGDLAVSRASSSWSSLPSGDVFVAGGIDSVNVGGPVASTEMFSATTHTWTSKQLMSRARDWAPMVRLSDGRLLVSGGYSVGGATPSAEIYDPSADTWSPAADMHAARYGHTATLLTDGRVLVTGGYGAGPLASAEIYDPVGNTWTDAQPMSHPRWQHLATRLSDGRVLVVSGQPDAFTLTAEIYDPTANTWSPTADLAAAHGWGTLTVLPSGQVLVAGGASASDSTTALERYDPATNSWTTLSPMSTARTADVAVALADGELLVAGGLDVRSQNYLRSVEIYNPASDTWRAGLDSTSQHAVGPVGALLPDGSVLLAAGRYTRSSELYAPAAPPVASKIAVTNSGYSPASVRVPSIGSPIIWTRNATAKPTHTVTESVGLCAARAPLFSSGPLMTSYTTTLNAAGTYAYRSVGKGDTMRGSVAVPMSISPAAAPHTTTFHFSWAKTLPCGAVEDVAMRYQAPKSKKWSAWQPWMTGASTPGGDYLLNLRRAPIPGRYDFRARLRNPQTGATSGWSPVLAVTATP